MSPDPVSCALISRKLEQLWTSKYTRHISGALSDCRPKIKPTICPISGLFFQGPPTFFCDVKFGLKILLCELGLTLMIIHIFIYTLTVHSPLFLHNHLPMNTKVFSANLCFLFQLSMTCGKLTLNKNINATLLSLLPFFMSWTQRSKTSSTYTIDPFLSNIFHRSV